MAVRKNITQQKGKGKQYHLPYTIILKLLRRRGEGDENIGKDNQDLKIWGGEEY